MPLFFYFVCLQPLIKTELMQLTDTHAHLYLPEFAEDRDEVIGKAINAGIDTILLPNIDADSLEPMVEIVNRYPGICYPMLGIHPTSIKADYQQQLEVMEQWTDKAAWVAIGETGIDLYWDKTYFEEQKTSFRYHLRKAVEMDLPIVIHTRESFQEVFDLLDEFSDQPLRGVFHAFTGDHSQAEEVVRRGFHLGIGGIVTFKNSDLRDQLRGIDLQHLLLETDSPYLAPVPKRGKRNESSYMVFVAEEVGRIYGLPPEEVAQITSENARQLFPLNARS